jgi:hypothetical protein
MTLQERLLHPVFLAAQHASFPLFSPHPLITAATDLPFPTWRGKKNETNILAKLDSNTGTRFFAASGWAMVTFLLYALL